VIQNQSPPREPVRLEIFTDRLIVKEQEGLTLSVWVESRLLESGTLTVHLAQDQLHLEGTASRPLPQTFPLTFALRGQRPGKSSILVRLAGTHKDTKEAITASQRLEGIEVQARTPWWSPLLTSSLLGVMLGALLTFRATWLHERRQRRRERAQRQQWVLTHLPALLSFDRNAVRTGRETRLESWRNKLLNEGYYTELEQLTEPHATLSNLASRLIHTGFLVQDYEESRARKRLEPQVQQHLEQELEAIIQGIKQLAGERQHGVVRNR
jgi:hypothetical protein